MITKIITIITVIVSLISFQNISLKNKLIFNPYLIYYRKEWYRFVSSGFIHADIVHLAFNMFTFYFIGQEVERYFIYTFEERGSAYFVILYVSALVMSIIPTYKNHREFPNYNGLGASGAVSAILFTLILFDPMKMFYFYGAIPIRGIFLGIIFIFVSYYFGKKGGSNINHSAHLWGALLWFHLLHFSKTITYRRIFR